MILKESESDGANIHALSAEQILPLVERLANNEKVRYTGIYGTQINQAQCSQLKTIMDYMWNAQKQIHRQ